MPEPAMSRASGSVQSALEMKFGYTFQSEASHQLGEVDISPLENFLSKANVLAWMKWPSNNVL